MAEAWSESGEEDGSDNQAPDPVWDCQRLAWAIIDETTPRSSQPPPKRKTFHYSCCEEPKLPPQRKTHVSHDWKRDPENFNPDFPVPDPRPIPKERRHPYTRHYVMQYQIPPTTPHAPPTYEHFLTRHDHPPERPHLSDLGSSLDSEIDSMSDDAAPLYPHPNYICELDERTIYKINDLPYPRVHPSNFPFSPPNIRGKPLKN